MSADGPPEKLNLALHEVGEAFHSGQRARLKWADTDQSVDAEVVSVLAGRIVVDARQAVPEGPITITAGRDSKAAKFRCKAQPGPGGVAFLSHFERVGSVQDRTWVRVPYFATITFTGVDNDAINAVGLDISSRGLACICKAVPPEHGRATFAVRADPLEVELTTEVALVRMRETGQRSWVAAYEFVALTPAEERSLCEVIIRLTSREFAIGT
jgi:hypothetical protein